MKGIKLFASKAAQRAVARSVWRSEQEEKRRKAQPQLCRDDSPCYRSECADHGCMDACAFYPTDETR